MLRLIIVTIVVLLLSACRPSGRKTPTKNEPNLTQAIATLRGAYTAFNRGDMDAAVAALDPEIDWSEPAEFAGGGPYHGRDEVKRYLTQSQAGWAEGRSEPERFIIAGNRIVVFVHARFRLKGSTDWQDVKLADVYTVRDGKIVAMRAFADRDEALRWAGATFRH